ncbi:MAG: hypothetical protein ONB48_01865 [candidate division KSB1 bacterium]|nr:hypothetical protein [candidate division KSB1 bacterium]MDZ7272575.1 hypothetical protein [candidate division KSB1 bacterium]MDZ7284402.1 hypothetical protein [candidate division KSB1 bacterium]MDZ7297202.1 hypothetical protein [candidate division KSB1 bacterium]MDZ7308089.1 hypothetical protein [candidate division KSB1 bacterium]
MAAIHHVMAEARFQTSGNPKPAGSNLPDSYTIVWHEVSATLVIQLSSSKDLVKIWAHCRVIHIKSVPRRQAKNWGRCTAAFVYDMISLKSCKSCHPVEKQILLRIAVLGRHKNFGQNIGATE